MYFKAAQGKAEEYKLHRENKSKGIKQKGKVAEEETVLPFQECASRFRLITEFLETKGDYPLRPDGCYITAEDRVMHGLGLSGEILEKIYGKNFLNFIKK